MNLLKKDKKEIDDIKSEDLEMQPINKEEGR